MHRGYIKLWRRIEDDPIMQNHNAFILFIYLLLNSNHKETNVIWNKKELQIKKGQILTGREKLSKITGLSEQKVRTSLDVLRSTNKITIKTFSKFSIITINKWESYQHDNQQNNQQTTNKQPADNQQVTTNNNKEELKEQKEIIADHKDVEYLTDIIENRWLLIERPTTKIGYKSLISRNMKRNSPEAQTAVTDFIQFSNLNDVEDYRNWIITLDSKITNAINMNPKKHLSFNG